MVGADGGEDYGRAAVADDFGSTLAGTLEDDAGPDGVLGVGVLGASGGGEEDCGRDGNGKGERHFARLGSFFLSYTARDREIFLKVYQEACLRRAQAHDFNDKERTDSTTYLELSWSRSSRCTGGSSYRKDRSYRL